MIVDRICQFIWRMGLLCSLFWLSACSIFTHPSHPESGALPDESISVPNDVSSTNNGSNQKITANTTLPIAVENLPTIRQPVYALPPAVLASNTVEYHVWQPLSHSPAEAWHTPRVKMYTYVLFNSPVSSTTMLQYQEQRARQRLIMLLGSIGRAEDRADTIENQSLNLQATNLFLIPSNIETLTTARIENYSLPLSRQYLAYFGSALATNKKLHKQLHQSGPFLLSTLKPIGEIIKLDARGTNYQIDTTQPILLVDMTGAHEKSIVEVVRTFKNQVAEESLTGIKAFEPMRLKLVSLLLKLNDAIPVVNNAVAGSCNLIGVSGVCSK